VNDRHLRERVGHDQRDRGANQVAEDDRGTGLADGHRAAEEQADADGAAGGDHRKLARRQAAAKSFVGGHRSGF